MTGVAAWSRNAVIIQSTLAGTVAEKSASCHPHSTVIEKQFMAKMKQDNGWDRCNLCRCFLELRLNLLI